jgi:hypothetical protein
LRPADLAGQVQGTILCRTALYLRSQPLSFRFPFILSVITMPRFARVFDQDDIGLMASALDGAWNYLRCRENELSHPDRAEATRRMLARRIILAARSDRRRHGELLMSALYGVIRNTDFETNDSFRPARSKPMRTWSGL